RPDGSRHYRPDQGRSDGIGKCGFGRQHLAVDRSHDDGRSRAEGRTSASEWLPRITAPSGAAELFKRRYLMSRTPHILAETPPTARVLDHREMHVEHRCWQGDIALWNDELHLWQQELQTALADMHMLEDSLKQHQTALQAQIGQVESESGRISAHEHALAEYEAGAAQEALIALSKGHQQQAERHDAQLAAQERIKKHHHQLMAHWHVLLKALSAPM